MVALLLTRLMLAIMSADRTNGAPVDRVLSARSSSLAVSSQPANKFVAHKVADVPRKNHNYAGWASE